MESLTTDITTQYAVFRDMATHHSNCVGNLWLAVREKTPEQQSQMMKIVKAQKTVANKLKKLHASLEEASNKLTQTLLEQQSQLPEPGSPLPDITIQSNCEGLPEGVYPTPTEANLQEPAPEATQQETQQ